MEKERCEKAYNAILEVFEDYEYQPNNEVKKSLKRFLERLFNQQIEYDFSIYDLDEIVVFIFDIAGEEVDLYDLDEKVPFLNEKQIKLLKQEKIYEIPYNENIVEFNFRNLDEAREEFEEFLIEEIEAVRSFGADISYPELVKIFGTSVEWEGGPFEIVQVCDTPVYYLAYCEYPYYEPVFDLLLDF